MSVKAAVSELIKWHNGSHKFYHIHGTGKVGYESFVNSLDSELSSEISVREYISDMDLCMAAADLVISRAGAITLSEIEVQGKAAILIPSPYVTHNHQYKNALVLEKKNAGVIIEEDKLSSELLLKTIDDILKDQKKYDIMNLYVY